VVWAAIVTEAKGFDRSAANPYYCAPMSDSLLPEIIKPLRLAKRAAILVGTLPLSRMPELDSIQSQAGVGEGILVGEGTEQVPHAQVELAFSVDPRGVHSATGSALLNLSMSCQRCLSTVCVVLKANIALAFLAKDLFEDEARHEQFQANLPAGFEIYPVADDEVELASLIEQELLFLLMKTVPSVRWVQNRVVHLKISPIRGKKIPSACFCS
jgi:uncharacterized metal-binding protein YceD (DUF177 family)